MPPRRRGGSGFRGVRVRPSGTYSASIRLGGGVRLGLGTFDTAQDGARAYDAAAWRLRRSRWDMNFTDVATPERAHELAPFPRLITDEDRRKNRRRERRLSLAEMDEEAMALWRQRFPQDIINEEQFFAERRRAVVKARGPTVSVPMDHGRCAAHEKRRGAQVGRARQDRDK
ncbi:uncharacterized protein [Aegilops tauschii subsp. strangulata]|uniref:uncharacterized protein n=1 Tax=Aegilops tauschii subsp. strangulata TaxID=200361 RepID=UPI001ABC91E9|nr:ethylene-responsive transcription factor ERF084-like [Aegilops tauschii subsp. strangulata]